MAASRRCNSETLLYCTGRRADSLCDGGEGPPLVRVNNWFTHLELDWDSPVWPHWLAALADKRMLVRYDPRGSGLSDGDVTDFSLDALGYVKNEQKLQAALEALQAVRGEMVPRLRLQSTSKSWNTGWLDALDVCSMLDACEATVRSGLNRRESREPFYRDDYPYVDNENWMCRNIISRVDGEWCSRVEPIPATRLKPDRSREPFFEADC